MASQPATITTTTVISQSTQSPDVNTSPVGSPPLILGFLAVGIFFAAMIAVFGWRRVHFGREPPSWRNLGGIRVRRFDGPTPSVGRSGVVGLTGDSKLERPKLWEVWTDQSTKSDGVDYGFWDNIMVGTRSVSKVCAVAVVLFGRYVPAVCQKIWLWTSRASPTS